MTKEEFKSLFERALDIAAKSAEEKLGRPIPRAFEIEMHGGASQPRTMNKNQALDSIYMGPERFYRVIDISIIRVGKDISTVFVCISGHTPGTFSETWNQPPGSGPFKQLAAEEVKVDT